MKLRYYCYFSLFIISTYSFGQVIDPSILSQLSPDQIEQVKETLASQGDINDVNEDLADEPESLIDKDPDEIESTKFGYDFFSKMPTSLTAVGDLPLPNDYKISLKDQLRVILSGSKNLTFDLTVGLDGTILFPEIGSIMVVGLTFGEVQEKLSRKISESYIGTNIDISLKDLSAKKITIVGAVNTPGTYLVNPFTSITSALAYSGGVSEIGSLRDIKLIRSSGEIYSFDLYELLIKGNRKNDLNVQAGDTILITAAKQFVEIKGAVNRPGIYELQKNEKLEDAIQFSLGFNQTANKSNISISTLDTASASVIKKTTSDLRHTLEGAIDITVFNYMNKERSNVQVFGAVKEPGFYSLDDHKSLSDLIGALEFVDVYPWLAVLEQFDEKNLIRSSKLFSLKDKTTQEDINLLPNSRVYFANFNSLEFDVNDNSSYLIDQFTMDISHDNGQVSLPIIGNFSIIDLINFLGFDMSDVEEEVTFVSPIDNRIISESYKTLELNAAKYSFLKFRSPINDLVSVSISGAVEFPGQYTLKANSSLQDLYELVGEFKDVAYLDGIILKRDSVRETQVRSIQKTRKFLEEAVLTAMQESDSDKDSNLLMLASVAGEIDERYLGRISGSFLPGSNNARDTLLKDGDEIVIPRTPSTINVFGEVLNPISFRFNESLDINDALEKAGGFKKFADQSNMYVIQANGEVKRLGRNIFMKNYNLRVGDTIIVPRKFITTNPVLKVLAPTTQILSDIAFSAAAIENLSNN